MILEGGRWDRLQRAMLFYKKIKTSVSVYTTGEMQVSVGRIGDEGSRKEICPGIRKMVSFIQKDTSKRPESCRAWPFSSSPGVIKGHRSPRHGRPQIVVIIERAPVAHRHKGA